MLGLPLMVTTTGLAAATWAPGSAATWAPQRAPARLLLLLLWCVSAQITMCWPAVLVALRAQLVVPMSAQQMLPSRRAAAWRRCWRWVTGSASTPPGHHSTTATSRTAS